MIPKMTDLRHIRTGLSALDIHEACNESAKLKEQRVIEQQIAYLGDRYICSKANAPVKGNYDHRGMPVPA